MKQNPFKPEHFIEPDIQKEMDNMHTNEYIARQDRAEDEDENVFIQEGNFSQENFYKDYSEDDQKLFGEIEKGIFAHINEVTSLPPSIAQRAAQSLEFLNLASVTTLYADAARYLGSHRGKLYLSGLSHFEFGVAEALGKHVGYLDLARLETITQEEARVLAHQKGDLRLSSLKLSFDEIHKQESEAICDAFLHHEGEVLLSAESQEAYELYKTKRQDFKKVI